MDSLLKLSNKENGQLQNENNFQLMGTNFKEIVEDKVQLRIEKARELFKQNEIQQSIAEYQKAIFLQSQNPLYYKELGDVFIEMGDISSAIMMYNKSNTLKYNIMIEDTLKELLIRKGTMLLEQGDYNDFLEGSQYESFDFQMQSTNIKSIMRLRNEVGFINFFRAQAFMAVNYKVYALEQLEQSLKANEKFIEAMIFKAKILWSQNKHSEGNEVFWKVENLQPGNQQVQEFLKLIVPKADSLLKETRYLLISNELERSLLNVKKGLELFPNNTQFLLIKAFIFRKKAEYETSLNNLLLAFHTLRDPQMELEVKNQISLTYNEMGIVLYQREQYEEAITLFNESIQFKNNDWGVLANRGDCFRSLGKIDLALKDYYQAQNIASNNGKNQIKDDLKIRISLARNSKGIYLFNQKYYIQAIHEFDEAINLTDNVASFYHNRSKCHLQMQNLHKAISDLIKSNELDPNNHEVATLVKKLKDTNTNNKNKKNVIYINKDE